jgi:Ca2+-transporting ATPase
MAARHALVRRLIAVETLGSATVICTDKTGTLTTGVMTVRELWGANHRRVLDAAAACCDSELGPDRRSGIGDPTEIAILAAAVDWNIHRADIEAQRPRVSVNPFDADRKRMSVYRANNVLYVKGAVEAVLQNCRSGAPGASEANAEMAARGLRVLAIALGPTEAEEELDLIGLIGIADPPRSEAIAAIARARRAGIRTVMITGDHPITARAIARELGIVAPGEREDELVHARATPEDKLEIVRRWKARGDVVAMTGDGVNDAPALREAHIGIAMGRTGTEVTREASDIVLTDDNIASVVAAVEEGRGIFDNIRKTVVYLLAGNAGELGVMFVAALIGLPLPLLPLHLLWINLVTDGLPALALVTDPPRQDIMDHPPRRVEEPILGRREWWNIAGTGLLQAAGALGVFAWALRTRDLDAARNLAFSVLVFGELLRAFAARDPDRPFWEVGVFTNLRLLGVVAISVLVQLGIHHIPATQALFEIGALTLMDCVLSVVVGMVPLVVLETSKLLRRHRRRPRAAIGKSLE